MCTYEWYVLMETAPCSRLSSQEISRPFCSSQGLLNLCFPDGNHRCYTMYIKEGFRCNVLIHTKAWELAGGVGRGAEPADKSGKVRTTTSCSCSKFGCALRQVCVMQPLLVSDTINTTPSASAYKGKIHTKQARYLHVSSELYCILIS